VEVRQQRVHLRRELRGDPCLPCAAAHPLRTSQYSLPWYDAAAWTAEIDRLAMWGVNLPLGFSMGAQEAVLRDFYIGQGLTPAEVDAFISGPAFLPWQPRMGNMQVSPGSRPRAPLLPHLRRRRRRSQGWGGPTPPDLWERARAFAVEQLAPCAPLA